MKTNSSATGLVCLLIGLTIILTVSHTTAENSLNELLENPCLLLPKQNAEEMLHRSFSDAGRLFKQTCNYRSADGLRLEVAILGPIDEAQYVDIQKKNCASGERKCTDVPNLGEKAHMTQATDEFGRQTIGIAVAKGNVILAFAMRGKLSDENIESLKLLANQSVAVLGNAQFAIEKKSAVEKNGPTDPAKETMKILRMIATAVEAFAVDKSSYPQEKDVAGLATKLERIYIRELPRKDGWGNPIHYFTDKPGSEGMYWLISYGADGKPDAGLYEKNGLPKDAYSTEFKSTTNPNDDIIFSGGRFQRAPTEN